MTVDLQQFQNPKYTGENRCIPCTITNVCLAAVLGALVFVVSPPIAAPVVIASLAAIYFRGYLVPGTPTLTKRYVPDRILAVFDSHHSPVADVQPADAPEAGAGAVDPEQLLLDLDVVRPCVDEDDLCLTESFASDWYGRMRTYRDDPRDRHRAAHLLDAAPDDVTIEDDAYPRITIDWRTRRWPSDGALIADTAADAELEARYGDWRTLHVDQRLGILKALRTFIETCPVCDGVVEMAEDTIESCCRSRDVLVVACQECTERFLELDPEKPGVEGSPAAGD